MNNNCFDERKLTEEEVASLDCMAFSANRYFCGGDYEAADQLIRVVANFWPDHPMVENIHGLAMVLSGKTEEGFELLNERIQQAPKDPKRRLKLATALAKLGRYQEAKRACQEAVALDGQYVKALGLLGAVMLILEEPPAEIEALLRGAVQVDPKSAPCWFSLGNVLRQQEKFQEASQCIQTAVSLEPDSYMAQALRQQELEDRRSAACRN